MSKPSPLSNVNRYFYKNIFSKINNYNDFYYTCAPLTRQIKGDMFEILTYFVFIFCPEYKNLVQKIWFYDDIPYEIKKELKLPKRDHGIDLLLQINGKFVPIQCKFKRNINKNVTWKEIGTFCALSFAKHNKTQEAYLVTNTYGVNINIQESDKIKLIIGEFFNDLPDIFFTKINDWFNDKKNNEPIYIIKKPRNYQNECIQKCVEYFQKEDRGIIELACGSGKTLLSYFIDNTFEIKLTVFFVPSLYLLSQSFKAWFLQSNAENIKIAFLLIGSDADLGYNNRNGIQLTTNEEAIKKFMTKNKNNKTVIFCTYQSADVLINACKNIEFDLGIFDEAHKTVGQKDKEFSKSLDHNNIKIKKRLFMTATMKMYKGKFCDKVISMDKKEHYGGIIYSYSFGRAIRDKNLTNYSVISLVMTKKKIWEYIRKNKLVDLGDLKKSHRAKYVGTAIMILKEFKKGRCNHMITYHNKIKDAKSFQKILNQVKNLMDEKININILTLDGKEKMYIRKHKTKIFEENERAIICSAKVLNEGIDIPITDSVCFVDRRKSTIDIVQCIGRCLRLFNDKEQAHVFVPIEIDDIKNIKKSNRYYNIIEILKALKTVDENIIEYFKLKESGKVQPNFSMDFEYYDELELSEKIDVREWENAIRSKIWRLSDDDDSFEIRYDQLVEFVTKNNKLPRTNSIKKSGSKTTNGNITTDEKELGKWCAKQRKLYKKKELTNYRITKLENITGWKWIFNIGMLESIYYASKRRADPKTRIFYSKDLFENELKQIVNETGTTAKKPRKSGDQKLQILEARKAIKRIENGKYKIINEQFHNF